MTSSTFSANPLGPQGIDFYQNPPVINANRPPSSSDSLIAGTIWVDHSVNPPAISMTTGGGTWPVIATGTGMISTLTGNTGGALSPTAGNINIIGSGATSVAGAGSTLTITTNAVDTITGNSGGAIAPVAGNINIVGAAGTTVAGAGNTLTITAAPQTFTWNNNATSTALVVNNGYIVTAGAQAFSLPATSAVGDEIAIMLNGGTSWQITQGAGQRMRIGSAQTTAGAGGSAATATTGDTIWLICTVANTNWQALSFVGTLTVI